MSTARIEAAGEGRFRVIGAMNFESAVELLRASEACFTSGRPIEIDLAQVSETDSAGLALTIEWLRQGRVQRCPVSLINLPHQLVALARISEVDELLGPEAADLSDSRQSVRVEEV